MNSTLRNILGNLIANTLIRFGFVKRARRNVQKGDYILSLCFHAPGKYFFESCITWLSIKGFRFISVDDLEKASKGEIELPKSAVLITIDDGWKSNLENIVPVTVKYDVPVTIFVSTEVVEKGEGYWWSYINEAKKKGLSTNSIQFFKTIDNEDRLKIIEETKTKINITREALTVEQIIDISKNKNISIGSHSVSHPILTKCSDEKSAYEIIQSKKIIEQWINKEVKHFAYPNGDFTMREVEILKNNGYSIAFSTKQEYLTKENLKDNYNLPRLIMVENTSFKENICRMMGVWPVSPNKNKHILYP